MIRAQVMNAGVACGYMESAVHRGLDECIEQLRNETAMGNNRYRSVVVILMNEPEKHNLRTHTKRDMVFLPVYGGSRISIPCLPYALLFIKHDLVHIKIKPVPIHFPAARKTVLFVQSKRMGMLLAYEHADAVEAAGLDGGDDLMEQIRADPLVLQGEGDGDARELAGIL